VIVIFVASGLFILSKREAGEAVRQYGHNVDSGVIAYLVSMLFLLPASIAFAILQSAALAWFLLPPLWEVFEMVAHRF
jgi:glucose uptake protein GlcU